jgi:hypothetical protein
MIFSEITEVLTGTFNISPALARSDLKTILADWEAAGLLRGNSLDASAGDQSDSAGLVPSTTRLYQPSSAPENKARFGLRLAGSSFLIRMAEKEWESSVRPLFAHLESSVQMPDVVMDLVHDGGEYLVVREGSVMGAAAGLDKIAPVIGQELLRTAYLRTNYLIAVHGAVVHDGSRSVILAGPSGAGKTTLTAALIYSGLGYFTDDVAILERHSLRVLPVPVGLRLKESSWKVVSEFFPVLEKLPRFVLSDGSGVRYLPPPTEAIRDTPARGLPVRSLVFPRYVPGEASALYPIRKTEALRRLQGSGYDMSDRLDAARISELLQWIEGVACYDMLVNSLPESVSLIKGLMT